MPTIAQLCKEGKVIPYRTEELEAEELRVLESGVPIDDLLAGINFHHAASPISRSETGLLIEQFLDKEHVKQFCKMRLVPKFSEWQTIQEAHYADYFHYWTAGQNNMTVQNHAAE